MYSPLVAETPTPAPAAAPQPQPTAPPQAQSQTTANPAAGNTGAANPGAPPTFDMDNPDTFIDISDALKSKAYVHRAILSTVIRDTARFNVASFYINHLLGFSSVYQRVNGYAKYDTGMQELSVGYVTSGGHGVELGLEMSAVSNVFLGYRYFLRPENFSLWPFFGGGVGIQTPSLNFAQGPPVAQAYAGQDKMGFLTFGLMIPLVDVGLKAEARANFYGMDRLVLSTGIGAVIFL